MITPDEIDEYCNDMENVWIEYERLQREAEEEYSAALNKVIAHREKSAEAWGKLQAYRNIQLGCRT